MILCGKEAAGHLQFRGMVPVNGDIFLTSSENGDLKAHIWCLCHVL